MNISKIEKFEQDLFDICIEVDKTLEVEFGNCYKIHPNRLKSGDSANVTLDGLFRVTTSFTAGYGSKYGRGYLIIIDILTLDKVDLDFRDQVLKRGVIIFEEKLKNTFLGKNLKIVYDGGLYKIIGDCFK